MGCPGIYIKTFIIPDLLLTYVNDMKQAVDCGLFLYADDSCLVNKLSILFGENKPKCVLFGTKHRLESVALRLNMVKYKLKNIIQ